jgi:hypothetical protein
VTAWARGLVALAIWAMPQAAAAAPAPPPPVALEGPSTVEFVDVESPRRARVSLKPSTIKPGKDEEPRVLELALGNLRDPGLEGVLSAAWDLGPTGTPLALRLELKDSVRRPGTYRVVLAPLPTSRPSERLEMQIELRPAKLGLPERLVVDRTLWLGWAEEIKPRLTVREESRSTRLSMVEVTRVSANRGALPVSASLIPAADALVIAPGRSADVPYSVDAGAPLGTITGKLRFWAPELAEAASLDYEIRTRLSARYIPLIIAIGFLLGWLVRKRLAQSIRLGEAREAAGRLLSQVTATFAERPDATFRGAVEPARRALEEARSGANPDAVTDATTALDQQWRTALADFAQRRAAAATLLDELRKLAAPPLPLPAVVTAALQDARAAAERARTALDRNDAATAHEDLGALGDLARHVHRAALDWQDALHQLLEGFRTPSPGLPASLVKQFDERLRTSRSFDTIKPTTPFATPNERAALFLEFHAQFREARNRLAELAARLDAEWAQIEQALAPVQAQLQAPFHALAAAVAACRRDLETAADDPAPLARTLPARLQALGTHWRAGLLGQAPAPARPRLLPLYEKAEFVALAQGVAAAFGNAPLGGPTASVAPTPWPATAAAGPLAPAELTPSAAPAGSVLPAPVEVLTVREARFLQSALLAVLYIGVYWGLNADTFGAQLSDVATLLLTSFGLDLGVDGLLKLKK